MDVLLSRMGIELISLVLFLALAMSRICRALADYWNMQILRWKAKVSKLEFAARSNAALARHTVQATNAPVKLGTIPVLLLLQSASMPLSDSFADTATDDEIEQAARFFVEIMRAPLLQIGSRPPDLDKAFALMKRALLEPEELTRDIIHEAKNTDPNQLRADLAFAREFMRSPRKTVMGVIGPSLPAGTPGKRPQITPAIEQRMVDAARMLWPAVQSLIEVRQHASKRTLEESLGYLEADHPEASRILLIHIKCLESFFARPDQPKRKHTKTRLIICEILSEELGLSRSYVERWVGPTLTSIVPRN